MGVNCTLWVDRVSAGAPLLTVNQRLARYYAERFQQNCLERGRYCWETPAILPLSTWLAERHAEAVEAGLLSTPCLPELLCQRLWQRAVEADRQSHPENALLLDSERVAAGASRAWQRAHAYALDITSETGPLSSDCRAFRRWAARFETACRSLGAIDASRAADQLVTLLERNTSGLTLPAEIILAGFLIPDRRQRRLKAALEDAGVAVRTLMPTRHASLERLAYADDDAELTGVAQSVRAAHEACPAGRLGVVIADLGTRRSRVLRAFDRVFFPAKNPAEIARDGRPYDLSLGAPLARQALVQAALDSVDFLIRGLDSERYSRWLLSPYLVASQVEARLRCRLDKQLRNRRVRRLDVESLLARLPAGARLARALDACAANELRQTTDRRNWSRRVRDTLEAIGWPGNDLGSEEYQSMEAWYACLDDFDRLDEGESASAATLLADLQSLAANRIFQPETQASPIAILGRLESHGIEFDRLWVTGLDQDQWPPTGSPDPFLPVAAQRAAGIPEADAATRLALAQAEFDMWSNSTCRLTASHALSRDGNSLQAATVIATLPAGTPSELSDATRTIAETSRLERVLDCAGPPVSAGAGVLGGARLFEDQARCPFKAFATHRLGVRALEEAGPGLDARQHGTLLHAVLEHFWTAVQTHDALVDLFAANTVDAALGAAIDRVLADAREHWPLTTELEHLERRRLLRLLREWLELKELPRRPFCVVATEAERTVCRAGIAVTLKVDRIDRLHSGEQIVLDYKTGSRNQTRSWDSARIENPQLPLYALSDDSIDGVCFAQIARHAHRFIGMAHDEELVDGLKTRQGDLADWSAWRRHWASALDALADEIAAGHAGVTPIGNVCDFCELRPVCRINPGGNATADDEEGNDDHAASAAEAKS